ncbi:HD-GYP domain-containing protein [Bacteriovorax sp. BSW11_IV]|uniref:HD-GYP domain-containing protein n=1 Tax=Bacteriovorax sp. BSW11_IV TaxID=1353529 RepID=UPI000698A986|nr:HD-GYP domain-containing protein [Bacteriovorax sp. BSW11_IV]
MKTQNYTQESGQNSEKNPDASYHLLVRATGNMTMTKKPDNVYSIPELLTNMTLMNLSSEVEGLKKKQKETCEMAARSILYALDCKDHYTYGHSTRVAFYSLALGRELGLNEEELYELELSALFHDIGKIGVPDSVLLKPTRLTEEEFLQMKAHPTLSYEILKDFEPFGKIAINAKHHHERFDGRGYPDGLKGDEIPFMSRIILIADTFDAMTSTRPYRKGLPYDVAFNELEEFSGSQFDPALVKHFINAMKKEESKNEKTFTLSIVNGTFEKDAA